MADGILTLRVVTAEGTSHYEALDSLIDSQPVLRRTVTRLDGVLLTFGLIIGEGGTIPSSCMSWPRNLGAQRR